MKTQISAIFLVFSLTGIACGLTPSDLKGDLEEEENEFMDPRTCVADTSKLTPNEKGEVESLSQKYITDTNEINSDQPNSENSNLPQEPFKKVNLVSVKYLKNLESYGLYRARCSRCIDCLDVAVDTGDREMRRCTVTCGLPYERSLDDEQLSWYTSDVAESLSKLTNSQ